MLYTNFFRFPTIGLAVALLAVCVHCHAQWTDDFESYENSITMRKVWTGESPPNLATGNAKSGEHAAKLSYNGQACSREISFAPRTGDELTVSFWMNFSELGTTARAVFGEDNLSWIQFQGGADLRAGETPKPVSGSMKHNIPALRASEWKHVVFIIRKKQKSVYDVLIDGAVVVKNAPFVTASDKLPTHLWIGYMGEPGGAILVDDVTVSEGKAYELKPEDLVSVSLGGVKPLGGWRFYDNNIKLNLDISGDTSFIKSYTVSLFSNSGNYPDEADPEAAYERSLIVKGVGVVPVDIPNVKFGMYTLRVNAVDAKGTSHVLYEELVSMIHRITRKAPAWPPVWAVCTHADRFDRRIDLDMKSMAELGANWSRMEMIWGDVYRNGKYDFSHHDKMWKAGHDRGINFFGLLNTTASGAEVIPGSGWGAPPNLDKWEEFCRTVMAHFNGRIQYWEIWNEPDGYAFWWFSPGIERARYQAEMIKIAVRVAREISPDIRIMGPCVTRAGNNYLLAVAEAGGLDNIDILSTHARFFPDYRSKFYERILAEKLPNKHFDIWYTEGAEDLRALVSGLAGENPATGFLYVMRDKGTDRANFEHNNGLTKRDGLPKNSYIKYQFLLDSLAGSTYVGKIGSGDGLSGYVFSRDGEFTAAVWKRDDRLDKEVPLGDIYKARQKAKPAIPLPSWALSAGILRYDLLGNPLDGKSVGVDMILLKGSLKTNAHVLLDLAVRASDEYREIDISKKHSLDFVFTNATGEPQKYSLQLEDNECKFPKAESVVVNVQGGEIAHKAVEFTASQDMGYRPIYIHGEVSSVGDAPSVMQTYGPYVFYDSEKLHTETIYTASDGLNWIMPNIGGDVHTTHSTGVVRNALDQDSLSKGSGVALVSRPEGELGKALKLYYKWEKPGPKWTWMARRYSLKNPIKLQGVPVLFSADIYMENNTKFYPLTILLTFQDPTGKEIRIEGGEVFWTGWREWSCFLPSFLNHGRLHSVSGGNGIAAIDTYPLKFTGLILNQPPGESIIHLPPDAPVSTGYILMDNLRIQSYGE